MRRLVLALVAATALLPAVARADYNRAQLVTVVDGAQVSGGTTTALDMTPDGRFVVWASNATTLRPAGPAGEPRVVDGQLVAIVAGGVYRTDLQTGRSTLVWPAFRGAGQYGGVWGASRPSISADGRYVAFNANGLRITGLSFTTEVYVRDMERAYEDPAALRVASVSDGPDGAPTGGEISSDQALSDDGTRVAMTAGGIVRLRDLAQNRTLLVSAAYDADEQRMTTTPVGGNLDVHLSGDGSTVAWRANGEYQVPFFANEISQLGNAIPRPTGEQILWRRIADGPQARTRRVGGAADLDDANCPFEPERELTEDPLAPHGPCDGFFAVAGEGWMPQTLSISGDGTRVAFANYSWPRGVLESPRRAKDVFMATMYPGDARKTATRAITREGIIGDLVSAADVTDVAISPDGTRVAFTTERTRLALPDLPLVGPALTAPGVAAIYVADLTAGTTALASIPADGAPLSASDLLDPRIVPIAPVLADEGVRVAFSSPAQNLAAGDANRAADVFVTDRVVGSDATRAGGDVERLTPAAPALESRPAWRVRALARPSSSGRVALDLDLPAAGRVEVTVESDDPAIGRRRRIASATARLAAAQGGPVSVSLTPDKAAREALAGAGRIEATARVRFVPTGPGTPLERTLRVAFVRSGTTPALRASAPRRAGRNVSVNVVAPAAGLLEAQLLLPRGRAARTVARVRRAASSAGRYTLRLRLPASAGAAKRARVRVTHRALTPVRVSRVERSLLLAPRASGGKG